MRITVSLVLNSIITAVFAGMLVIALGWPGRSRVFPVIIAIVGLTFSLIQQVKEMSSVSRKNGAAPGAGDGAAALTAKKTKATPKSEAIMLLWTLGGMGLVWVFGFWVAIPAFLIIFMRLYGHESWKLIWVVAGIAWGACYVVFHLGLKFSLYGGLLGLTFF